MKQFQSWLHHAEPNGMFKIVVVIGKCLTSVERRIDVNTLDLSRIERQQRLEGFQIVTLNQQIAGIRFPRREIGVGSIFQQPVGRTSGGAKILVSRQPVQNGHGFNAASSLFLIACFSSRLILPIPGQRDPAGMTFFANRNASRKYTLLPAASCDPRCIRLRSIPSTISGGMERRIGSTASCPTLYLPVA